jgi:hypothetical protein
MIMLSATDDQARAAVLPTQSWVRCSTWPGCIGKVFWVRFNAWIWDISSTHNTIAFARGLRYRPTMSLTLASSSGSVENLNVSAFHGFTPYRFQTAATVTWPVSATNRANSRLVTGEAVDPEAVDADLGRWRLIRIMAVGTHQERPSGDPHHTRRECRPPAAFAVSATKGAPVIGVGGSLTNSLRPRP